MKILGWTVATILVVVAYVLISGWTFMLAIGIVHGEWLTMLPTIGFKSACLVGPVVGMFLMPWNMPSKS